MRLRLQLRPVVRPRAPAYPKSRSGGRRRNLLPDVSLPTDQLRQIRNQYGGPLLNVRIEVQVWAASLARARRLLAQLVAVLRSRSGVRGRFFVRSYRFAFPGMGTVLAPPELDRWMRAATHDVEEIFEALEEALALLDRPGEAYAKATPMVRRMMNQALFEQLQLLDGDVTDATFSPWLDAMVGVARPRRVRAEMRQVGGQGLPEETQAGNRAQNDRGPLLSGGHGLRLLQMVRVRGL